MEDNRIKFKRSLSLKNITKVSNFYNTYKTLYKPKIKIPLNLNNKEYIKRKRNTSFSKTIKTETNSFISPPKKQKISIKRNKSYSKNNYANKLNKSSNFDRKGKFFKLPYDFKSKYQKMENKPHYKHFGNDFKEEIKNVVVKGLEESMKNIKIEIKKQIKDCIKEGSTKLEESLTNLINSLKEGLSNKRIKVKNEFMKKGRFAKFKTRFNRNRIKKENRYKLRKIPKPPSFYQKKNVKNKINSSFNNKNENTSSDKINNTKENELLPEKEHYEPEKTFLTKLDTNIPEEPKDNKTNSDKNVNDNNQKGMEKDLVFKLI